MFKLAYSSQFMKQKILISTLDDNMSSIFLLYKPATMSLAALKEVCERLPLNVWFQQKFLSSCSLTVLFEQTFFQILLFFL